MNNDNIKIISTLVLQNTDWVYNKQRCIYSASMWAFCGETSVSLDIYA